MRYPGFIGPSAPSQSALVSQRLVNWYLEKTLSPGSPEPYAFYPTPGQRPLVTVADTGTRGGFAVNGRCWLCVGGGVYEKFSNHTMTKLGDVSDDTFPATFSYNPRATGAELAITSGGNLYTLNISTNVLTLVLTGEATMGGMLNNRYLAFNRTTGVVKISNLNGATFTEFFARSKASDPWQIMLVGPSELWLIGEETGEVWYDSGASPQPFAPIPGAFFKMGIAAPFAGAIVGEQAIWLSSSKEGAGRIVAARGYSPQPISNYAVDTAIASYARVGTLLTTEILTYEQEGHPFAVFSFPGNGTWVVDLESGAWHERLTWNIDEMRYEAWRPRIHVYAFNQHLVGERTNGTIAELDVTVGTEANGGPIRRLRIAPPIWAASRSRAIVSRFELLMDAGLGTASGQGADPAVMFRSTQNGRTWSTERMARAGKMGEYDHQAVFNRCGSTVKLWAPEIVVTDPIPWRIVGANIDGSGFASAARAA